MRAEEKTPETLDGLRRAILSGDRMALARAISLVENQSLRAADVVGEICPREIPVIGVTGAPGVGKSTLINGLVHQIRRRENSVAVVSIDPSSPLSGGAILGDRLRMGDHISDPGVFVRSLASRGHLGGLCKNIREIIAVVKAPGEWDVVILETVGAGQSETEISLVADVSIVVTAPEQGDDIQAMKAGILEIADILVVNKTDLPGAASAVRSLQMMLELRQTGNNPPIIEINAIKRAGVADLAEITMSLFSSGSKSLE